MEQEAGETENKREEPSLTHGSMHSCSHRGSGGLALLVRKAAIYRKFSHKSALSIPFTQVFCFQQDLKSKSDIREEKGSLFANTEFNYSSTVEVTDSK